MLLSATVGLGQDPAIVEDITVPTPSIGGSFESGGGGYESVLVDDGAVTEEALTPAAPEVMAPAAEFGLVAPGMAPATSFDRVFDQGEMPAVESSQLPADWWTTCTSAISHGIDFLPGGCNAHGQCRHGHACGPGGHGGGCRDACGDGCGPCHGGCRPGAVWAIQADALVLWRNNIDGQPLLVDDVGAVALDAGDVRTAAAAGPRIGVLRSLGCGRAVEASYFNVGGIQGSTDTDGSTGPYRMIGLADLAFGDIDSAEYTTRGQIKSAEFNYRWCQGRRIIWLAGVRWIEWNETGTVDYTFVNPDPFGDGDIQTRAGNDLYGGQFGCRLRFWDLGKWQVAGVGKAGAFSNTAYQRTTADVGSDVLGPIGADDTDIAFFGEVGINSTLWLTHWLAWRAGYNFFWLQGVATAPQQFPLGNFGSDTASINTNGAVFLQGFSTGLEARW